MKLTEQESSLLQYILQKEIKLANQAIELTGTAKQIQYWEGRKRKVESIQEKIRA